MEDAREAQQASARSGNGQAALSRGFRKRACERAMRQRQSGEQELPNIACPLRDLNVVDLAILNVGRATSKGHGSLARHSCSKFTSKSRARACDTLPIAVIS